MQLQNNEIPSRKLNASISISIAADSEGSSTVNLMNLKDFNVIIEPQDDRYCIIIQYPEYLHCPNSPYKYFKFPKEILDEINAQIGHINTLTASEYNYIQEIEKLKQQIEVLQETLNKRK